MQRSQHSRLFELHGQESSTNHKGSEMEAVKRLMHSQGELSQDTTQAVGEGVVDASGKGGTSQSWRSRGENRKP